MWHAIIFKTIGLAYTCEVCVDKSLTSIIPVKRVWCQSTYLFLLTHVCYVHFGAECRSENRCTVAYGHAIIGIV
jgi:hypothetical protein